MLRSQFHDSFEYSGAVWTDDLFDQFQRLRGYDLRGQMPALFGEGPRETVARIKYDVRLTISDLHRMYIERWTEWSHAKGTLTRNQAHGSPSNLIDTYAAADIPETEVYQRYTENDQPMMKFASSAAHLKGTALASAEAFTWLGGHFQCTWAMCKNEADFLFLCGVNHIFYHGIPYSPAEAAWPGFQFYASTNFGPEGGLWHDEPAFNAYVARCQAVLQSGRPSNDVLLYVPFQDMWQDAAGTTASPQLTTPGQWMANYPYRKTSDALWERGFGYDQASDRFIAQAKVDNGAIIINGSSYRAVVLPRVKYIEPATLRKLMELAEARAKIVVEGPLPADVPGFADLAGRQAELKQLSNALKFSGGADRAVARASAGSGAFVQGDDLEQLLAEAGVKRETMRDAGLRFIRRTDDGGHNYFIANWGSQDFNGWITLAVPAVEAVILDPMFEDRTGEAAVRKGPDGATQVYLQLAPQQSLVLRTFLSRQSRDREWRQWKYAIPSGPAMELEGNWKAEFIDGGPVLPQAYETRTLGTWTARDDPELRRFAGTAKYTLEFEHPLPDAEDWMLDLGRVAESARVIVNGRPAGTLLAAPYQVSIGPLLQPGRNQVQVVVTNLAFNRVRDLDARGIVWRIFYDANISNFPNAANLPIRESGLIGPVRLVPLKKTAM
jgi:hypothetical protein